LQASQLQARASELESRLARSQLNALEMQLQPHFLFNTHHAIQALIIKGETQDAARMLGRLSDMLRLSLQRTSNQEVTLAQELELLDLYLSIQQVRFKDRLRVTRRIDPACLGAVIPNLLLQPLVENAVLHGIAPHSSAGQLHLEAIRRDHRLLLSVCDDGPGLAEGGSYTEGIGLGNTRARLERLYGQDFELDFNDAELGGLCVTVGLPYLEKESGTVKNPVTL